MKLSTYTISLLYLLVCSGPAQTEVSLRISPERTQLFQYESMSLGCEEEGTPMLGWSVNRKTIEGVHGSCNKEWGSTEGGSCLMEVYLWDGGVYWCQSESGELSRAIDITISEGVVILENPVLPVKEGSDVTLRCLSRNKATKKPSSDLPADFYRNGSLISTESTGQMTIHSVSKSDVGFYKCNISDLGQAPESWMDVRDSPSNAPPTSSSAPPTSAAPSLMSLPRLIIYPVLITLYVVSTIHLVYLYRDSARAAAIAERRHSNDVITSL